MLPLLIVIVAAFALLFVARVGAARRALWLTRWPALALGAAALVVLARGWFWPAIALGLAGALVWTLPPGFGARRTGGSPPSEDAGDAEARAALGLSAGAGETEIREAYRVKMRRAHPDQGGSHAQAARLTAARDHLLRKR